MSAVPAIDTMPAARRAARLWRASATLVLAMSAAPAIAGSDTCPFLPEYRKLRATLSKLPAAQAAAALEQYSATHDNPEGCEAADIDRRLAPLEAGQFLATHGRQSRTADVVFRCNQLDAASGRCTSPMEDGTAHVDGVVKTRRGRFPDRAVSLASRRPDARLIGVYLTTLPDVIDGKPPSVQPPTAEVSVPTTKHGGRVLMAIYETGGPWRYRKAVWYF